MDFHFGDELDRIEQDALENSTESENIHAKLEAICNTIDKLTEDTELAASLNSIKEAEDDRLDMLQEIRSELSSRLDAVQEDLERITEETNRERDQIESLGLLGENTSDLEGMLSQRMEDIQEQKQRLQEIRDRYHLDGELSISESPRSSTGPYNSLTEYFHDKNYSHYDYKKYSQDPHWRMLMRKEHPEVELPPLDRSVAKEKLQQYMSEHNYGRKDYHIYSRDPIWQELHKAVFPEFSPTRFQAPDYIKGWRLLTEHVSMEETLRLVNPNYSKGTEWSDNCQRCGPAYEMRRRGFDVTAQPVPLLDYYNPSSLMYRPFEVWEKPDVIHCHGNDRSEIEAKMAEWGDGARAQIVVKWKNAPVGHVFIAEQKNGTTIFIDPQNGDKNVNDYFNRIDLGKTEYCRIDTLPPSRRILECCREVSNDSI